MNCVQEGLPLGLRPGWDLERALEDPGGLLGEGARTLLGQVAHVDAPRARCARFPPFGEAKRIASANLRPETQQQGDET
eukprot:9503166-Pyramimonas_sp.AAC.4